MFLRKEVYARRGVVALYFHHNTQAGTGKFVYYTLTLDGKQLFLT